jgi:hypothetical protein
VEYFKTDLSSVLDKTIPTAWWTGAERGALIYHGLSIHETFCQKEFAITLLIRYHKFLGLFFFRQASASRRVALGSAITAIVKPFIGPSHAFLEFVGTRELEI